MVSVLEICAGAGGQALGFEQANFNHAGLVEIDSDACATLTLNRPTWNVINQDVREFDGLGFEEVDVLAGGVPCPPFSVAGRQLGPNDERDLFPDAIRLLHRLHPKFFIIENVRGLLDKRFSAYREDILAQLEIAGYQAEWNLLNASDFGVPQLRPRSILVAALPEYWSSFRWPSPSSTPPNTVGAALFDQMAEDGWQLARAWAQNANKIAPTLVGGSRKHGGADLGPTRAKKAWASLGVNGISLANTPPSRDFVGSPRLTVGMTATVQGFPDHWDFSGAKTSRYRQIGNAFPPPVAKAVAKQVMISLQALSSPSKSPSLKLAEV